MSSEPCYSNFAEAYATHHNCGGSASYHRVKVRPKQTAVVCPVRLGCVLCVLLFIPISRQSAWGQPSERGGSPDGKALFVQNCAKCHGEAGQGISALLSIAGPNIQAEHDPGAVMTAVEVGPSHMPSFVYVLTVPQMNALARYVTQQIAVIPLGQGDLSDGGKMFRRYCAPCHRTAVRGGALAFTGINAPALTSDSAAIVAGAIRWGPGPMPPFPKSVLSDQQLDSIVKYVQFVQHPPSPGGSPMNWYGPVAEGVAAWVVLFALIFMAGWIEKGGNG
jgi:ubiquinol-cytochrome c reductase cytochrome c subunit